MPPQLVIIIVVIVVFFIGFELFLIMRRAPSNAVDKSRPPRRIIKTVENVSFENRVIAQLQSQTGYFGQFNPRSGLIEVVKFGDIVGIVKCCEDGWSVTPALIDDVVRLRTWYHVNVAYIAVGGKVPSEARQIADAQNVRLMRVYALSELSY